MTKLVEFYTLHEDYDGCFHKKHKVTIDFSEVTSIRDHYCGTWVFVGKHVFNVDASYKKCKELMDKAKK